MSRPRKTAVKLVVDVDGVEVPATLRPPRDGSGYYHVRWKMHGVSREATTGQRTLFEAERVARQIIRGEKTSVTTTVHDGMSVKEFESVQQEYFSRNSRKRAGAKTAGSFNGVWQSFLRTCPVKTIQEVTAEVALKYVRAFLGASKTRNHNYGKKTTKTISAATVQKHVRTLAAAWNRVRCGHSSALAGIKPSKMVRENPWELIRNNVPKHFRKSDPVQFDLENGELERFLDKFERRPIAELFLIVSLWSAGRIEEISHLGWSWFQNDHIVIPDSIAKRGRGKVIRLPPAIKKRLEGIKIKPVDYVFAGFAAEVERLALTHKEVLPFSPARLVWRMEKLVKDAASAIGNPSITHHALRRTAMELSDEAELLASERTSAEKLQTTVGNKRQNYTKRGGKKRFRLADGLYENLTTALRDYPRLAARVGCEPTPEPGDKDVESVIEGLTPIQKRRLLKRLQEEEGGEEEEQVVA